MPIPMIGAWLAEKAGLFKLIGLGLVAVAIIGAGLTLWHYKAKSERLETERDAAVLVAEQTKAALVEQQASSARQITTLEAAKRAAVARSKKLTNQLNEVYSDEEAVTCPVPGFVQRIINGL